MRIVLSMRLEHVRSEMAARHREYTKLWAKIAEEYSTLRPQIAALRAPEANFMQLDAGGKAVHYEWKVLHAPSSHVEVALHFEGYDKAENQTGLRLVQDHVLANRITTTPNEVFGDWSAKWTRYGVRVGFEGEPDHETAKKSARAMHSLVERTYMAAKEGLDRAAATGWLNSSRHK